LPAAEKLHNTVIKLCRKGELKPAFYPNSGLEDLV
jgi:hypothetical protein